MTAVERYDSGDIRASDPAIGAFSIVPADDAELQFVTRSIYVGTGGDVRITDLRGGTAVTFKNVPSGSVLPVRAVKVFATGTTATDMLGLD